MYNKLITSFLVAIFLSLSSSVNADDTKFWVGSDNLSRRTCGSLSCGVVGKLFFREGVIVLETRDGWSRISKYYDASCRNGISQFVDSGASKCTEDNGISKGKFAEWVKSSLLLKTRPTDPAKNAVGVERLIAQSDDYRKFKTAFTAAAEELIAEKRCTPKDFLDYGGWVKSSNRGANIYFTYCNDGAKKLYLNAVSGQIF